MLRIVIAGQTYIPPLNGQGVFSIHLAEGMSRAGHDVLVIMPSDRIRAYRTSRKGVDIRAITAVPLAPFYSEVHIPLLTGLHLGQILDEFRPDVVHLQDHYPLCRGVLNAALERDLPLIATNHFLPKNVDPYVPLPSQAMPLLDRLLWNSVLDVFNQVDLATAPSETAAGILREQGIQVPVRAISNGVDLDRFHPDSDVDRAGVRQRYGLDAQRMIFLYVGRLAREKRLDVLMRAFQRLDRADVQLAIAGHGDHAKALHDLADRLLVGRRVVFTGFVPDDDLPALLNSVDVFAMPSEAELQSIATLEAMATGRPVLAANARALPELVEDGVNGYLFEAGDAEDAARHVARLADERERWPEMSVASLSTAQSHSLENTLRRYEEHYHRLSARKATDRARNCALTDARP